MRQEAAESINKTAQAKGLIGGLDSKYQDAQAWVLGIERTIRQIDDEMNSTAEDIEQKRKELETVNRRLIELETHREVSGESGYGRAVEAILAAGINGVHGTIGQLGIVPDEYRVALETAIGPRLDTLLLKMTRWLRIASIS